MLTGYIVRLTHRYHLLVLALAALGTLTTWPQGLSGVLLGGGLMAANFAGARWLGARAMGRGRRHGGYVALLALKMAVLLAMASAVMVWVRPDFVAFAAGMASFFVGLPCALVHAHLAAARLQAR